MIIPLIRSLFVHHCIGLDWIEFNCIGLDWIGLDGVDFVGRILDQELVVSDE
jgi:hypothetical protein